MHFPLPGLRQARHELLEHFCCLHSWPPAQLVAVVGPVDSLFRRLSPRQFHTPACPSSASSLCERCLGCWWAKAQVFRGLWAASPSCAHHRPILSPPAYHRSVWSSAPTRRSAVSLLSCQSPAPWQSTRTSAAREPPCFPSHCEASRSFASALTGRTRLSVSPEPASHHPVHLPSSSPSLLCPRRPCSA